MSVSEKILRHAFPKTFSGVVIPTTAGAAIGAISAGKDNKKRIRRAFIGGSAGLGASSASVLGAKAGAIIATPIGLFAGIKISKKALGNQDLTNYYQGKR